MVFQCTRRVKNVFISLKRKTTFKGEYQTRHVNCVRIVRNSDDVQKFHDEYFIQHIHLKKDILYLFASLVSFCVSSRDEKFFKNSTQHQRLNVKFEIFYLSNYSIDDNDENNGKN